VQVATGKMTPSAFVRATSTAAAQLFNIYPRKGLIAAGSDADIVLLDPAGRTAISARTHHSAIDTNVYEGRVARGAVTTTISRGRVVWADGKLDVQPGTGRFVRLARPRCSTGRGLRRLVVPWLTAVTASPPPPGTVRPGV